MNVERGEKLEMSRIRRCESKQSNERRNLDAREVRGEVANK